MKLKYFIDRLRSGYKGKNEYAPITAEAAYLRMSQDAISYANGSNIAYPGYTPIYIKPIIEECYNNKLFCKEHWWRISCKHPNHTYVMCLDCDNEMGMLVAARVLKANNIGYAIIKSSNQPTPLSNLGPIGLAHTDHFWLITDVVGSIIHVVNWMRTIPGVDSLFIDYCQRKRDVFLRAYPKNESIPIFPTSHTLINKLVIEWYDAFKIHFELNMKSIALARKLQVAYNNGKLKDLIYDPEFEV